MDIRIKEWTLIDSLAIASVHVKSWQTTYRGIISDDYLDDLDASERTKKWEKILSDPNQKVFVTLEWEKIVWFATCDKSEEFDWYDSTISSIYLLKEYQGKGIWRKLFNNCLSHLQQLGCHSMYIWVLADNPAKNFYEKMGGEYMDRKKIEIGNEIHIESLYGWKI
jgi:GNAT superfamily N-acetyltransferase